MAESRWEDWRVRHFHAPPSELRVIPARIQRGRPSGPARPPRLPDVADATGGSLAPRVAKERKRSIVDSRSSLVTIDSCADDPRRVGNCRMRLDDGRIAVLPIGPSQYCRDFSDDDHEVVVVEMQAAPGSQDVAWLDDETVSVVLVADRSCWVEIPREKLRRYVRQCVPMGPCTRNLSRAVYTMCQPCGADGPVLTLALVADVLRLVADAPSAPPEVAARLAE